MARQRHEGNVAMSRQSLPPTFARRLPGVANAKDLQRMAWAPSYRAPRADDVLHPHPFVPHEPPMTAELRAALDAILADRENRELRQRHASLLTSAPWAEWLAPYSARDVEYVDGVPESMSLSGRAFISLGATLVRFVPLRKLRLVAVAPYLDEFASVSPLAQIESLNLAGNHIGEGGLRHLANSSQLGRLNRVNLSDNSLTPHAVRALLRAPWLHQIRGLAIAANHLDPAIVDELLDEPAFADVQELDLGRNNIGPSVAVKLPQTAIVCLLRQLNLAGNQIGPGGAAAFFAGDRLDRLRDLDLSFNAIGPAGAAALATAESFHRPQQLDLSFNAIEDMGVEQLTEARTLFSVRRLNLRSNRLGAASAIALGESNWLSNVCELDVSVNPLGDEGVQAMMSASGLESLRRIELSNTNLTSRSVCELGATVAGLEYLGLSWNALGDAGVIALAENAELRGTLDLRGVEFSMKAANALATRTDLHVILDDDQRIRFRTGNN
jgi:Leucine Rich repeat